MKKQFSLTLLSCIILPVSTYFFPSLVCSIIGGILIISITVLLGFKWGVISAVWASMIALTQFTPSMNNSDIYAIIGIYFLIALGAGKTLDVIRKERDYLREKKNNLEKKNIQLEDKEDTLENTTIATALFSENGEYIYINKSFVNLLDYEIKDDIITKLPSELFENEYHFNNILTSTLSNGFFEKTFKVRKKDGKCSELYIFSNKVESKDGTVKGVVMSFVDTEKIEMANENIKRFCLGIEQNPCMIIITDLNGKIEYINPAFSHFTGYSQEELIGEKVSWLQNEILDAKDYATFWETVKNGDTWKKEFCDKKKTGEPYWVMTSISPIKDTLGKTICYIAVQEDIANKKALEEEVNTLKLELENLKTSKFQLLYRVAEEVSMPLNDMIKNITAAGIADQKENIDLSVLQDQVQNLIYKVDNVKEFATMHSNKIVIKNDEFDIRKSIENLIYQYSITQKENGLDFICYIKPNVPYFLNGDKDQILKVLDNLIINAVKFTNEGEITILIEKISEDQDTEFIKFFVSDTGTGMDKDKVHQIFNFGDNFDFSQMGLFTCKKIIEAMGGSIGAISKEQEGSIFYFTIPLKKADKSNVKQYFKTLKNINLLSLEDNETTCIILEEILESWGVKVKTVINGEECINAVNNESFEIIIIDSNIKNTNIIDLVKQLKKTADMRIVLLINSFNEQQDREKYKDIGIDDFIVKPLRQLELNTIITSKVKDQTEKSKHDKMSRGSKKGKKIKASASIKSSKTA